MSENSFPADDASLRSDVRRLGELLGQTLVRQESQELLDLVERVRKSVREGNGSDILENLDKKQSIQLVRAFANYFNLANIAEQVHRARVLTEQRVEGKSWLSRAVDRILEAQGQDKDLSKTNLQNWIDNFSEIGRAHV